MKARIINRLSDYFDVVIDVKGITYKYIFGLHPGLGLKTKIPYEDVDFIYEYEWEKNVVKYRTLLKISLPKAVSYKFYAAVFLAVEGRFKDGIESIVILKDTNEKAKRKYWYKRTVLIINEVYPILISASGREYGDNFNIDVEDIGTDSAAIHCSEGICRLEEIISISVEQLNFYRKVLHSLENPQDMKYTHKAIEGESSPL